MLLELPWRLFTLVCRAGDGWVVGVAMDMDEVTMDGVAMDIHVQ